MNQYGDAAKLAKLALVLAIVSALLSGCSRNDEQEPAGPTPATETPAFQSEHSRSVAPVGSGTRNEPKGGVSVLSRQEEGGVPGSAAVARQQPAKSGAPTDSQAKADSGISTTSQATMPGSQPKVASETNLAGGAIAGKSARPEPGIAPEQALEIFDEIKRAREEAAKQRQEASEEAKKEEFVPSVIVFRRDTLDSTNAVVLSFTIVVDPERAAKVSGLVVSQRIPPGWNVEASQPPLSSFDPVSRVAKWLLVATPVADGSISCRTTRVRDNSAVEDWPLMASWYTYLEPGESQARSFRIIQE